MNDYSQGVLEALVWACLLLDSDRDRDRVLVEIREARDALLSGVGFDFRRKLGN